MISVNRAGSHSSLWSFFFLIPVIAKEALSKREVSQLSSASKAALNSSLLVADFRIVNGESHASAPFFSPSIPYIASHPDSFFNVLLAPLSMRNLLWKYMSNSTLMCKADCPLKFCAFMSALQFTNIFVRSKCPFWAAICSVRFPFFASTQSTACSVEKPQDVTTALTSSSVLPHRMAEWILAQASVTFSGDMSAGISTGFRASVEASVLALPMDSTFTSDVSSFGAATASLMAGASAAATVMAGASATLTAGASASATLMAGASATATVMAGASAAETLIAGASATATLIAGTSSAAATLMAGASAT
mmetsp:Transcript_2380/g.4327  ORF Transcript_2380/g.4327 Transcript_2380/m.4327 type:complete len:308 (+) Transcript_2380:187-1110(+)